MKIAFIGYGTMGKPMIRHLLAHGHEVRVPRRPSQPPPPGVRICASAAEAATGADAIASSLPDDAASSEAWFGPDGAATTAQPGALAVELSTVSVDYIDTWASRLATAGLRACDAPVTGSRPAADAGRLTAFIGASELFPELTQILSAFCSRQIEFGPTGSGIRFKLAYNMVAGAIGVAYSEGLELAERLGLSRELCVETFMTTGWASRVAQAWAASNSPEGEPIAFKATYMHKDLQYALAAAATVGSTAPLGRCASNAYAAIVAGGDRDLDFSAVAQQTSIYQPSARP